VLSLHQLNVFAAVARHLNYSRAAEELSLTQPAVSRHVQQLEKQLGQALFSRRGRRVVLTDGGRDVLAYTQRINALVDELHSTLAARKGLARGRLRLIATTTAGEYLLPPLVAAFRDAHPGIHVSLGVSNRDAVLRALAEGKADMAVMGRPPAGPDWVGRSILPNELVAIASPQHPRARDAHVEPAALAGDTFFLREPGSGTRLAVEGFLDQARLPMESVVELGSDSAIKQVVMAGLGISILARQALDLELSVGRLVILPVVGLPLLREWFLVQPAHGELAPPVAAFCRFLETSLSGS
jgi:LysR family transcriptional regulator, low CO2-responsive transcriptional regulator